MNDQDDKEKEISRPYKKPLDGFSIGGFQDPPPVPEAGFTVPHELAKIASDLRTKRRDNPAEIPQRWFVWLSTYEKNHPYGVKLKQRREEHFSEESSMETTNAEIEREKGNKLHKVLTPIGTMIPVLTRELKEAQRNGAALAHEIRQSMLNDRKADTEHMKVAFESVISALNAVTGLATTTFASRKDEMEDRMELVRLLREAQGEIPETSPLWGRIGLVATKLAQVLAPVAKAQGIDLTPLFGGAGQPETTEIVGPQVSATQRAKGKK